MDIDRSPDAIYHIEWTRKSWDNDRKKLDGSSDYGIYQVYGDHPVYGPDVLLYIGMAQVRTFAERLSDTDHSDFIDTHLTRFTDLRLGRFIDCDDINQDNWGDRGTLLPEISSRRFSNSYWNEDRYPWKPMVQP